MLLTATNGLNEKMIGKVVMRVGEGITGWVAETRRPAVVPDASKEPHWKRGPGLDEDRFQSMLSVPIASGPPLVGGLQRRRPGLRDFHSGGIGLPHPIPRPGSGLLER